MILWNGEVYINWKNKPHEPEWISWHDFQAGCTWFACKKCQEKFFVSDEDANKMKAPVALKLQEIVTNQHTQRIETLCQPPTPNT